MKVTPTDRDSLRLLAHGYYFSCALFAAVRLDLAGALAGGAKSGKSLAIELGTDMDATVRLLEFLTSIGILHEDHDHHFTLTNVGQYLRFEHSNSIAREISMFSGGEIYEAWGEVLQSITTGRPAFELLKGETLFSYLATHPESAERFHRSWQEITTKVATEVVETYDFSQIGMITDVGGGYGIFLATVLQHVNHLRGVLFDLPFSTQGALQTFRSMGIEDRVTVASGNAEEHIPPMEMCIMKSVIHGCGDEQAHRILGNCFAALPAHGKVLILERVIPKSSGYHWSRMADMTMMVMTGGRERTIEDYTTLYDRSGFHITRYIELPLSGFSIIEGSKA